MQRDYRIYHIEKVLRNQIAAYLRVDKACIRYIWCMIAMFL